MMDILYYLVMIAVLAGLVVGGGLVARSYMAGNMPGMALFGPKPERRLDIIEQASLDGRRRLMLIRRDDVEHLIMTGGPVDVVIETGIGEMRQPAAAVVDTAGAVYARPARRLGQAVGEQ